MGHSKKEHRQIIYGHKLEVWAKGSLGKFFLITPVFSVK